MSFESLITAVATQLINLTLDDIDNGIDHTLKLIGEFVQADRSFVALYRGQALTKTHEWVQEGISPLPNNLQNLSATQLPWLLSKLEQVSYIAIPNIADMPPEAHLEQQLFQADGIMSSVMVSMTYQNTFMGILGLAMEQQSRVWSDEISLLKIVGEMITNVIKRKEIEQQEKLAYALVRELASLIHTEDILDLTTNQLQNTFGYYHAQVYLLEKPVNPSQQPKDFQQLRLQTAAEDIGPRLKNRGRAIPINTTRIIVARAARSQETTIVNDVRNVDYYLPNPALPRTHSEVAIPLISEQELIGCLDVQHTNSHHFDENVIRILEIIAHQLSSSLIKAELFSRNQKLVEDLSLLQAIATASTETQDVDRLLSLATTIIHKAIQADVFGFSLLDDDFGFLRDHESYIYRDKNASFLRTNPGEGISGYVLNTGKAKNIPDVTQEPGFMGDPDIRSELCVPIKIQGRVIGVIKAESVRIAAFSEQKEHLLITIADYIATAMERMQLYTNAQKQAAEMEALLATSKAISSLDLEHVLNTIATEAKKLFVADTCRIHLIDSDGKSIRCVVALSDRPEHNMLGISIRMGQGITGSVALNGVPEIIDNTLLDRRVIQTPGTYQEPEAIALAPLTIRQHVTGVMAMTRRGTERPFSNADLDLLIALADQAAVAIDNARLFAAERRQLEDLTVLNQVATAAARLVNEEELLNKALNIVHQSVALDKFSILIADKHKKVMRVFSLNETHPPEFPMHQGVVGLVMANNQARNVTDSSQEPAYFRLFHETKSELCVPINIQGQAVGVINAESVKLNAFSDNDERFLKTLARQLAIGLEKIRLLEIEQKRAAKQQQLVKIGISLLEATNLTELWPAMASVAQEVLHADRTAVYLYDKETDSLSCPYAFNLSQDYTAALNKRFSQVPGSSILNNPNPVLVEDAREHPGMALMRDYVLEEGFCSYAVFQLPTTEGTIGAITLYRNKVAPFDAVDQAVGQTLGYITSVAFQNIQLLTEIRQALIREQELNDITRWLSTAPNLPAILATTIRNATELIGADAGLIGLVIDGQIMTYYPYNIPVSVNLRPAPKGIGIAWQAVETEESIIGQQYKEHPKALLKFTKVGVRAFLAVPIMAGETCLGALKLLSLTPGKTFNRRDLTLVESIGRQVGIVLQNRRLYIDLTERAQALTEALKKQEEADEAKNTFIHNVSHELRTPIGLINGYSELMQTESLGELTPEQKNAMNIIVKRIHMLINLLDDMSVLLAAETQEFRREEIRPNELLQSVVDEFQLEAEKTEIHLQSEVSDDLPAIIGDPFHLRRVFDNLLTNAFKFTPPGGSIIIRGWREGSELSIEVTDTGAGISPDEMQRIFERFYQANSKSTKHHKGKGTGLGLALVKEIVEAHRGKVTVRSSPGKGTAFKIRLPGIDL